MRPGLSTCRGMPDVVSEQGHAVIHVSTPDLGGREREYVLDCLTRGHISQGVYVRRFEEAFAQLAGTRYAVACSSGTAALHLALLSLGIGPSDTVIVPALTYVATANAARYCGARVVFCDIDAHTWQMDINSCQRVYEHERWNCERVVAIPVHLYDSTVSVAALPDGLLVVEDAAHAPGAMCDCRRVGSLGHAAAFSFYASKVIACGEGGMVTTDDGEMFERLQLYRGQGATTPGRYTHVLVGYNYRLTDVQGAIGLAQLERLPTMLAARRAIVEHYRTSLAGWGVRLQGGDRASGWMFAVLVDEGVDRDRVARRLHEHGIETRPFFDPLPSLPPYLSRVPPVAESVARRGLCLPTHTAMSEGDVDYVCARLVETVREVAA